MQGFSGTLSDKSQNRKAIAFAGFVVAAIAKPLMGLSTMWQGVFGARLLDRFGTGVRSAPRDALVASSVEEKDRGKAFGLEGLGDNTGAFLGPLVAAFLLYAVQVGLRTVFYLAVIPGLVAALMILLVKERAVSVAAKSKVDAGPRQWPRDYWSYVAVIAVFGLGNSSSAFLILRMQDIGSSLPMTILVYASFNLVAAMISYPAGSLSDALGRRNVLFASFLIFATAYLGFAVSQDVPFATMLFVLYGLHQGIFRAVGKALASDLVPEHLRASGLGWYSATIGSLQLVANIAAGVLWDRIGHQAVFYYGAAFAIMGSIALIVLLPARHSSTRAGNGQAN